MALAQNQIKILESLFGAEPGSPSFLNIPTTMKDWVSRGIVTEDDLKPYIDKLNGLGYSVDFNSGSLNKTTPGTAPTNTPIVPPTQPTDALVPTNPNLPSDVPGKTIPGPTIDLKSDRGQIEQEAAREKQQQLDTLTQAANMRSQGLGNLSDILQKQNQAQFNYDLPGIKEQLAGSGLFSSPSALASAVARESGMLGANTAATLGQAGVGNVNLQAQGLQDITGQQTQMQQSGLQRQFSLADYLKQAALAKEIGSSSLPQSPSALGGLLSGAGQGAIAAAPLWAANPALAAGITGIGAIGGASRGGGK